MAALTPVKPLLPLGGPRPVCRLTRPPVPPTLSRPEGPPPLSLASQALGPGPRKGMPGMGESGPMLESCGPRCCSSAFMGRGWAGQAQGQQGLCVAGHSGTSEPQQLLPRSLSELAWSAVQC